MSIQLDPTQLDPKQKQFLDDVFDAFSMMAGKNYVSLTHLKAGVTRYSLGYAALLGIPGEYVNLDVDGATTYFHPEDRKRYLEAVQPVVTGEVRSYDFTCRVRVKSGEYIHARFIGSGIRDRDGVPTLFGGITINQGVMEGTDPVTVLRNKYGFFQDLNSLMDEGIPAVVLLAGISRLSDINRMYGYSYGNRVLQETALLIQETVGSRGSIYRMDGASFAFLTDRISRREVSAIYDTIRLKMQRGIQIDGIRTILSAKGGLLSTEGIRMDAATVYSCLNYACRESKQRLNGELVDFNGSSDYDQRESLEMVNAIRDCILEDCKGFRVDYQPVMNAMTERPVGMEALIRWKQAPYGEVKPLRFIPILEKDLVFEELAEWILRRVLTDGLKFLCKDRRLMMSVNVSAAQIEDDYFVESVTQILEETGFPAGNLCLEVTKGCRLLEMERLQKVVNDLHQMDIRVVIDDFGSGFESVGFLKRLSADSIKFDRELVEEIERSEEDRKTMEYLARLAQVRGTQVCVKGVETRGMRDILRQFNISSMQGNLYAKPAPFETIMKKFYP